MKLHRGVLAAVVAAACMLAAAGCKGTQDPQDDPPAGDPAQPGAQGASDAPPNSSDDPTMRRARRHKHRRHGPQDGRHRRDGWRQRNGGEAPPDAPPSE